MKLIYSGRLLKFYNKKVRLPNGHKVTLELIEHPGAALIIPFLAGGKIILLRQFRPALGAYLYELPAGTRSPNESFISCAKREIIEETGFSAKKLTRLGKIYPVPGYSTEEIVIYKAEGLVKKESRREPDEVISVNIITKPKVRQLFKSGRIVDSKTICALALCGWLG